MRTIANSHKACTALALAIAAVVVVLLSPVPIGSTLANTKSFSHSGDNIKTETEKIKPHHGASSLASQPKSHSSFEHLSHCRHKPFSEFVNLFRHRLHTLEIVLACLT
ncbi:MAG: hypothetical protein WA364_25300 [Candidatus Nitrosopolaris sp.]|jgi:hypothetical protein